MKIFTTILILLTMYSTTSFVAFAQTETTDTQQVEQQTEQQEKVVEEKSEKDASQTTTKQQVRTNTNTCKFSIGTLLAAFLIPVFILIVFYLMFKVIKF